MPPELLLIIDLETTGLDPKKDQVIELGAILYSVPQACVLQQLSTLFPVTENPAEKINHISPKASQLVDDFALPLQQFAQWLTKADYLIAHNVSFDRQWFGMGHLPKVDKKWLCTYDDFVWSKNAQPTSLINTVLNYGLGVSNAHRALTDCQLIAALFDRVGESGELLPLIMEAIARSEEPKIEAIAKVNYDNRDLAKEWGFRWNSKTKTWSKKIRPSDLAKESPSYPFKITKQAIQ
jgi:DNA polymerase-3 subunit epsilon